MPVAMENLLPSDAFLECAAADQGRGDSPRLSLFSDWLPLIETDNRIETARTANLAPSTALATLGLPCASDDEAGLAVLLPSTALNNLMGVTTKALKSWTIGERHLLNHFLQSVSRALVVVEDHMNPFLSVIVPMALENFSVRHALVALTACHLSRVYPAYEHDVCIHRGKALEGVMAELSGTGTRIWALAATLLLCLAEISTGNSRRWLLHLHGARALLSQVEESLAHPEAERLIEVYNYISSIASVTSDQAPGRFGSELRLISTDLTPETGVIHPLFGVSVSLYESLANISILSTSNEESVAKGDEIELLLQSWAPPEIIHPSRDMTEARALGFALQWAVILRLRQVTRKGSRGDSQTKAAVDNILSVLSLIRSGSEMEARMLFPLFMAGVSSMTKASRLTIDYRLSVMEVTVGFAHISVARKLVDELWQRWNKGDAVSWEDLMREKYQGLVLF